MDPKIYKLCIKILREFFSCDSLNDDLTSRVQSWLCNGRHTLEKEAALMRLFDEIVMAEDDTGPTAPETSGIRPEPFLEMAGKAPDKTPA